MYIDVCIGGVSANFLVDTGATLSIVSTSFYDKLTKKPILQEFSQQITSADGGCLSVKGKGEFIFAICENSFQIKAVVANVRADGIIGLIFSGIIFSSIGSIIPSKDFTFPPFGTQTIPGIIISLIGGILTVSLATTR
jgi:hypothetical protein